MKPSALAVLRVLSERPEGITQMEALLEHGLGDSLAQRVNELRASGLDIRSEYESVPGGKRVVRYRYVPAAVLAPYRGWQPRLLDFDRPDAPQGRDAVAQGSPSPSVVPTTVSPLRAARPDPGAHPG